jgi:hypothetical protein
VGCEFDVAVVDEDEALCCGAERTAPTFEEDMAEFRFAIICPIARLKSSYNS